MNTEISVSQCHCDPTFSWEKQSYKLIVEFNLKIAALEDSLAMTISERVII